MVMESRYHSYNNPAITISQGELKNMLQRIEADFIESKVYLQSLTGLENSLGKSVVNLSLTLGSLGREAIRLTFRELAKHCNIVATATEEQEEKLSIQNSSYNQYSKVESMVLKSQPPMPVVGEEKSQSPHINSSSSYSTHPSNSSNSQNLQSHNLQSHNLQSTESILPPSKSAKKKGKKLTKLEMAAQLEQEREQGLREIGLIIHQARIKKGWSIDYLRSLTLITLHQIVALESGDLKTLPEDVYLRGFIYRLAAALHLDTKSLLQRLPQPDIAKTTLPSWYHDPQSSSNCIKPIHLYLGYSTLVAGALGGLAVINPQETRNLLPDLPTIFTSPNSPTPDQNSPKNKSEINSQIQETSRSIAPPESSS
jgi:cytoskeleton protein RodZ